MTDYMIVFAGQYTRLRRAKIPFPLTATDGEECVELLQNCEAPTTDDLIDMLIQSLSCLQKKKVLLIYHRSRFRIMLSNLRDDKDIRSYAITTILAAIDYCIKMKLDTQLPTTPSWNDLLVPFLKITSTTRRSIYR